MKRNPPETRGRPRRIASTPMLDAPDQTCIKRPERPSTSTLGDWIFGLSLAAFALSLALNAVSLPNRICHDDRVEFGGIDAVFARPDQAATSLSARNVSSFRSSASEPATKCATREVGKEPGY